MGHCHCLFIHYLCTFLNPYCICEFLGPLFWSAFWSFFFSHTFDFLLQMFIPWFYWLSNILFLWYVTPLSVGRFPFLAHKAYRLAYTTTGAVGYSVSMWQLTHPQWYNCSRNECTRDQFLSSETANNAVCTTRDPWGKLSGTQSKQFVAPNTDSSMSHFSCE